MKDEGGDDPQGNTVDALRAEVHVLDDPLDGIAPVGEECKARDVEEVGAEVGIDQDQVADDRQRCSQAAARPLQDQGEGEGADEEVVLGRGPGAGPDGIEFDEDVDGHESCHDGEEQVEIGHVVVIVGKPSLLEEPVEGLEPQKDEEPQEAQEDAEQKDAPEDQFRVRADEGLAVIDAAEDVITSGHKAEDHQGE